MARLTSDEMQELNGYLRKLSHKGMVQIVRAMNLYLENHASIPSKVFLQVMFDASEYSVACATGTPPTEMFEKDELLKAVSDIFGPPPSLITSPPQDNYATVSNNPFAFDNPALAPILLNHDDDDNIPF